jgi:hypothetical protein
MKLESHHHSLLFEKENLKKKKSYIHLSKGSHSNHWGVYKSTSNVLEPYLLGEISVGFNEGQS